MITINGTEVEFNTLDENPTKVKTDTSSISGNVQRMQLPKRKRIKGEIDMATPTVAQFLWDLYDAAETVDYVNTQSNVDGGTLSFTGIIDVDQDEYLRGGSLMTKLTVTIVEGDVTGE